MHKLITHSLIPALVCFLLCISNTNAQTQAIGYGGISNAYEHETDHNVTLSNFGSAIADMGNINNDGGDDLAVGAYRLTVEGSGRNFTGGIHILFMNDAGTMINSRTLISHGTMSIQLAAGDNFGISAANIGDFDGDGIDELAVGTIVGTIYILHLNANGTLKRFSTLDFNRINSILGNNDLVTSDRFSISIANLGDIDGDGIIDLAVGAHRDDSSGSVHILFMDKTETDPIRPIIKAAAKIDTGSLIADGDQFGISVANIGDLNQDGINDLAVGATGSASGRGAVHILLLNRNGSIKPDSFEIFDAGNSNIFSLSDGDNAGRSIANLGDLNGDGINDIAVGAIRGDSPPTDDTGAIITIFMKRVEGSTEFTTDDFVTINGNSPDLNLFANPTPANSNNDGQFGISIANIGDRNGDDIDDIAVGALREDGPLDNAGRLYILHMDAETVITNVTSTTNDETTHTLGNILDIQVTFSEAVVVTGRPALLLNIGNIGTAPASPSSATYTRGTGTDTLTFLYTVANGDTASDLDYVSTASLTLNGGTINAAATPNYRALLTLPKPGSRGSLSSNKNLYINTAVMTNEAPTASLTTRLEDLELTVGTSFTYTIPAEAFTDAQNDALIYTSTALPEGLSLDPTGIFSGAPTTARPIATSYRFTISDGMLSTMADINITVNAAPTLPDIDVNYSPGQSISTSLPTRLPQANGGTEPITYTLSPALPDGLTFSSPTRTITGEAPTTAQTRQYTYTAADKNGALAAQTLTITIKSLQALSSISDKIYSIGNLIMDQLPKADGGAGPISYELTPELPEELIFNTLTRTIEGRLQEAGQSTLYTYTATDSSSPQIMESIQFSITFVAETTSSSIAKWNGHISDFVKHGQSGVINTFNVINTPTTGVINIPHTSKFGTSIVNIGDIDGDKIDDLVVGGSGLNVTNVGMETGSIYILIMNADNTVKALSQIGHGTRPTDGTDGINLKGKGRSNFGVSMANIGDFDDDGINELAVGTRTDEIYILHLNPDRTLKRFSTIDFSEINTILGNDESDGLDADDEFSSSITNLGDIDGDGIIDLAVGAFQDDGIGSVHILFMKRMGNSPAIKAALKAAAKIDTRSLNLLDGDAFGISAANIGDFDDDGINDLAVGAPGNDGSYGNNQGAVHVLRLNRDGSIKTGSFESFEIFDTFDTGASNIFGLSSGGQAGGAIANLGDLNGDGINDLVVGAPKAGAVFTVLMKKTKAELITANDDVRIAHNSPPDLTLTTSDSFGGSIANIGDRNGDGLNDIAVGAGGTSPAGAFYILHMDAETVITAVTSTENDEIRYNMGSRIDIQVIFSESVIVDTTSGTPRLTLETGTTAPYMTGSGSNILTFAYIVGGDSVTDLDYEGTGSLELNGGTINAFETPNHPAILTLPEPRSRGSLSSNKNLYINTAVIANTTPSKATTELLPEQILTVGTSFTYTIPAGRFTDAQHDPLIYTSTALPEGLSLDPTGTFSGAPTTAQPITTSYRFNISDGQSFTSDNIRIKVNAALTFPLPTTSTQTYVPDEPIDTLTLPEATGGTPPITYTLSPAVLPGTLTFNSDPTVRTITGTPALPAALTELTEHTRTYTYTAEDDNGALATQTFSINIALLLDLNLRIKVFLEGAQ